MARLSPRVIKTDAPIHNRPYRCCEALNCTDSAAETVAGPGGVPLTLCPDHLDRLGVVSDA